MGKTTSFGLTKGYTATVAIPGLTIVKFGAADGTVVPAAGATDDLIGITTGLAAAVGERADVHMVGNIGEVTYGGTIARGKSVTSDTNGRAVQATTGQIAIGKAEVSGVIGDIGTVIIAPHTAA